MIVVSGFTVDDVSSKDVNDVGVGDLAIVVKHNPGSNYRVGKVGTVVINDRTATPFQIRFKDGDLSWFNAPEVIVFKNSVEDINNIKEAFKSLNLVIESSINFIESLKPRLGSTYLNTSNGASYIAKSFGTKVMMVPVGNTHECLEYTSPFDWSEKI